MPSILCLRCKELFSFKCNIISRFNKFRDTAIDLGSKKALLKTWNSLLNSNGNLNIQFN